VSCSSETPVEIGTKFGNSDYVHDVTPQHLQLLDAFWLLMRPNCICESTEPLWGRLQGF